MLRFFPRLAAALLFVVMSFTAQVPDPAPSVTVDAPRVPARQPALVRTKTTSPGNNVHAAVQDRSGDLWFGTTGEGIYRYDGTAFTNYTTADGLVNDWVWCILEDRDGILWFGTADGVSRFDGTSFTTVDIGLPKGTLAVSPEGAPTATAAVWDILQDRNGRLWFATTHGVIHSGGSLAGVSVPGVGIPGMSATVSAFRHLLRDDGIVNASGQTLASVEGLVEDRDGNIWFGGRGSQGVFRFDGRTITGFDPDRGRWLVPRLQDRSGTIWFMTRDHNALRYDGAGFTAFDHDSLKGWIPAMTETADGTLWFAHWNGVTAIDGDRVTAISADDGLRNPDAFSVLVDRTGRVWIGTREVGLYAYDGTTVVCHSKE